MIPDVTSSLKRSANSLHAQKNTLRQFPAAAGGFGRLQRLTADPAKISLMAGNSSGLRVIVGPS
jgi:hypothetical protein